MDGYGSMLVRIDSKNRDKSMYPHSNEYRVPFNSTLWNVDSLEVVNADIPMTEHAIPEGKNVLLYSLGPDHSTIHRAAIPAGTYTPTSLATALDTVTTPHMSWTYLTSGVMRCTTSSYDVRVYVSRSEGLSQMIGMPVHDDTLTIPSNTTREFENMVDTSGYTRYIVIRSDDVKDADVSAGLHPGLATLFPPYTLGRNGDIISPLDRRIVSHVQRVNKHKMSSIGIRLERQNGELYDTRGVDHVILVRMDTR